ncbi:DUF2059 domain-containing protein [Psychrobacter sp. T6-5]|uniref:DUF2059 domain-containing protein n=1 Tax=Psychrobacter sp. T6-5 TaxID=3457451 RepID=UPI003FD1C91A
MKAILKNTVFSISLSVSAIGLMLVPTLSAQAAVPTDASLLRLAKVTKVVERADDISNSGAVAKQIEQSMLASLPDDDISEEKRRRFDEIVSRYSKELASDSDMQSMNRQVMSIYMAAAKQHFSQEEVDAQIAFYSSRTGQSIIDKQPAMMNDYMAEVMPIVMKSTVDRVKDIVPKMAAEIKALKLEE